MLRILSKNPVLFYSEPSSSLRELIKNGWLLRREGCWGITEKGASVLKETPEKTLNFFEL